MTAAEVQAAVRMAIRAHIPEDVTITANTRLRTDLGLDSLTAMAVLCEMEQRFRIRLDDDLMYTVRTVGEVTEIVLAELSRRPALEG